jgi:hypothetical protein
VRRDVDRDVTEMLRDLEKDVKVVQWWDLLGLDKDKTVSEVRALSDRGRWCASHSTCEQKCCCSFMPQDSRDGGEYWQGVRDGRGRGWSGEEEED